MRVRARTARRGKGSQRCSLDLDAVTSTDPTRLTYGARTVPAVALDLPQGTVRLGCTDWEKTKVASSPLARFVSAPT